MDSSEDDDVYIDDNYIIIHDENGEQTEGDDEDGECEDEELVDVGVRKAYLTFLRRCIKKNLKYINLPEKCDDEQRMMDVMVKDCSEALEQKALRKCMVAKLYQHAVTAMMDEITRHSNVCEISPLVTSCLKMYSGRRSDKSTQTETDITVGSNNNNIDAERRKVNLQNLMLLVSSVLTDNIDIVNPVIANNNSNNPNLNDTINNAIVGNESTLPVSVSSTTVAADVFGSLNDSINKSVTSINNNNDDVVNDDVGNNNVPADRDIINDSESVPGDDRDNLSGKKFAVQRNGIKKEFTVKNRKTASSFLDARIERLKLPNDDKPQRSLSIDRSYLDDFSKDANKIGGLDDATKENEQQRQRKRRDSVVTAESNEALEMKLKKPIVMESIALMHSLDCELLELPVSKRLKINHKYVQLFGPNHSVNYYDVTDEQKFHACRKRIAHLVVTHLTKYYEQHRIANRSLFKGMAQRVTTTILSQTLYPDVEDVKIHIDEFFLNGKIISAEDDYAL